MAAVHSSLLEWITIDREVRFGKPCIRGHRITVQDILEWLSCGACKEQILADYPQLEPEDFLAVYAHVGGGSQGLRRMKRLFDESLSPKLVELLVGDPCRGSKSALRNGLAGAGDSRILEHASAGRVVIRRSCDYPTELQSACFGAMQSGSPRYPVLRSV
jgi:uncharacterized protein (DUF433 family)